MDPFDGTGWDLLDYIVDDVPSTDLYWGSQSADVQADFSLTEPMLQDEDCIEKECPKKRYSVTFCNLGTVLLSLLLSQFFKASCCLR
ncbi:hypothetical protein RHGRI_003579 [Rhododendron griersonianum]|uniref:Uncharacterized protein n=1 Tax=Rhododendron griersonianum TaxID=479676 RepID=A0AAV6L7H4_9ERIC|nr:hypothetical protein RHGRI_003579 [Rhododendron griersonianum]